MRAAYGLPRVTSFAQITGDVLVQQKLQQLYGNVNNIDAFVGALAEDHAPGADVGPLTRAVLVDQFTRLRDGDRFFYLNQFSGKDLANLVANTSLTKIIERNTGLTNLQANDFFFKTSIGGTVSSDSMPVGPGPRGHASAPMRAGVAGITVQLLDDAGEVVGTTVTDGQGHYRFDNLNGLDGTGTFTVRLVLNAGRRQTSPNPASILISRGDINVSQVNFVVTMGSARDPSSGDRGAMLSSSITSDATADEVASPLDLAALPTARGRRQDRG
jgi:hypothetical protein